MLAMLDEAPRERLVFPLGGFDEGPRAADGP